MDRHRTAISPSDWADIDEILTGRGINVVNAAVMWSAARGRHELYDARDMATRIAYQTTSGWALG